MMHISGPFRDAERNESTMSYLLNFFGEPPAVLIDPRPRRNSLSRWLPAIRNHNYEHNTISQQSAKPLVTNDKKKIVAAL